MSSPVDDEPVRAEGDRAPVDPALAYPRGNRLGLRHPRPTVVMAVAVLLVVGGAWAVQSLRPDSRGCTVTATQGPVAPSADGAFQAWWDAGGPAQAQAVASTQGDEVAVPVDGSFVKQGDGTWEWRFDGDALVVVHVDDRFSVVGVNRCERA